MRTVTTHSCAGLILALLGLATAAACADKKPPVNEPTGTSRYKAGQVWTYKTRPGEESSRIRVLRVQFREQRSTIVHIAVEGIYLKNRFAVGGFVKSIPHMAITEPALDKTVRDLEKTESGVTMPPLYKTWQRSFAKGRATVETRPVPVILELREKALAPRASVDSVPTR